MHFHFAFVGKRFRMNACRRFLFSFSSSSFHAKCFGLAQFGSHGHLTLAYCTTCSDLWIKFISFTEFLIKAKPLISWKKCQSSISQAFKRSSWWWRWWCWFVDDTANDYDDDDQSVIHITALNRLHSHTHLTLKSVRNEEKKNQHKSFGSVCLPGLCLIVDKCELVNVCVFCMSLAVSLQKISVASTALHVKATAASYRIIFMPLCLSFRFSFCVSSVRPFSSSSSSFIAVSSSTTFFFFSLLTPTKLAVYFLISRTV